MVDQMMVNLHRKRIERLAAFIASEMGRLKKNKYTIPYARMRPETQWKYDRAAIFLLENRLHPRLFLKVMFEFSKNFYPGSVCSWHGLTRYKDYLAKIKARYSNIRSYDENNSSMHLLLNDLYYVSSVCDPLMTMKDFYSDNERGVMNGYHQLKDRVDLVSSGVDQKTLSILEDLVKCRSASKSRYAELVVHASTSSR